MIRNAASMLLYARLLLFRTDIVNAARQAGMKRIAINAMRYPTGTVKFRGSHCNYINTVAGNTGERVTEALF